MTQDGNRSKCSLYSLLPTLLVHPHQRHTMGDNAHSLAMQGPLQIGGCVGGWGVSSTVKCVARAYICKFHEAKAVTSLCWQAGQLNDLLSKGYSICAFLSTNQARAMPSGSSNNPNGNLVLNSISDTTILLMQNSDRFGWQGRNACF